MDFSGQSDDPDSISHQLSQAHPGSRVTDMDSYYRQMLAFELYERAVQVQDGQPVPDLTRPLCLQDRLILADRQHLRRLDTD